VPNVSHARLQLIWLESLQTKNHVPALENSPGQVQQTLVAALPLQRWSLQVAVLIQNA
jgi:hypothetical protein